MCDRVKRWVINTLTVWRARILMWLRRYEKVIELIESLEDDYERAALLFLLGLRLLKRKDYLRARSILDDALQLAEKLLNVR